MLTPQPADAPKGIVTPPPPQFEKDVSTLFKPGVNCWRVEKAHQAAVLIDYGNYFRALYQAIINARHSILIVGWDLDSRTKMVRGKDAEEGPAPPVFYDLIKWKCEQDPHVQIYMNQWDYSVFFAVEREHFPRQNWKKLKAPNLHHIMDNHIPPLACHHQKMVIIDDCVAFNGGMDIALNRWDFREHHPEDPNRRDPSSPFSRTHDHMFSPYHDVMMLVTGPVAAALGENARDRWFRATGNRIPELEKNDSCDTSYCWPKNTEPQFFDVNIAIARTVPKMHNSDEIREIEAMYLDEVTYAENFVYIENQFLTQTDVAATLNQRMHEYPNLRLLAVSCDRPKGIMESKSQWVGRVKFRETIETGGIADRVVLAYPMSRENKHEDIVRVHSKLMIIDDRILHLGSSNLNFRSMGFDTECDLIMIAENDETRAAIAAVRSDLIREHTGNEIERIEEIIHKGEKPEAFLNYLSTSRQHLRKIDDEKFRYVRYSDIVTFFADPDRPIVPPDISIPHKNTPEAARFRVAAGLALMLGLIAAMALAWKFTPLAEYANPEKLAVLIREIASSDYSFPLVLAGYVAAGLIFFPVTALIVATGLVFGPVEGTILALGGSLLSAWVGFGIGRAAAPQLSRSKTFAGTARRLEKLLKGGRTFSVAAIRLVPIAPFSAVNLWLGMSSVSFLSYTLGSLLGFLPGTLLITLMSHAAFSVWTHPDLITSLWLALGVVLWGSLGFLMMRFNKTWQARHEGA
jgi:phospholipase D1/2